MVDAVAADPDTAEASFAGFGNAETRWDLYPRPTTGNAPCRAGSVSLAVTARQMNWRAVTKDRI